MLHHKALRPAHRGDGDGPRTVEQLGGRLNVIANKNQAAFQDDIAARFVAARYRIEPHLARLICDLAGIGREAA
jgi:hypothetical protein